MTANQLNGDPGAASNGGLPNGWVTASLGQVTELKYGKGLPERIRESGDFIVYGSNGRVGSHCRPLTSGPTVIVGRKGSVGAVHFSSGACWPIDTTYYIDDFGAMSPKLLAMILKWLDLAQQDASTAIPGLNRDDAYSREVAIPPLAEQERIVAAVERLTARIDAARDRLANVPNILKRFRQAVLAAACSGRLTEDWREQRSNELSSDDEELPAFWKNRALRELCEGFEYGSSQKSDDTGVVPVLRMGNLQDGKVDWTDLKYSSDPTEIAKYSLSPHTVLFNRTNSPELVGKAAIYRGERPAIFAGYLIRIIHGPRLEPTYLNYCLNEQNFREYCLQVKSDGVSQSNINAKKLAAYQLALPPIEEQREIVRRVESLMQVADAVEHRVAAAKARVDKLTHAVLAKAFRGELVPTEAELARAEGRPYESASELIARFTATPRTDGRRRERRRREKRVGNGVQTQENTAKVKSNGRG